VGVCMLKTYDLWPSRATMVGISPPFFKEGLSQCLSIFNLLDRSLVVLACIVPAIQVPFCFKTCWDHTIQTAFDHVMRQAVQHVQGLAFDQFRRLVNFTTSFDDQNLWKNIHV